VYNTSQTSPSHANEFKTDTARLVLGQQYSVSEACKAVGVGFTALRRWVAQLEGERGRVTPSAKAMAPDHRHIQEFEATTDTLN